MTECVELERGRGTDALRRISHEDGVILKYDWPSWLACLGIIAVAIIGKLGGSMVAARFTGMSWGDSFALGALMNTRGLVELIVLNIGYDLKILSPRIFAMLVLMALVTTFMTGPLLHLRQMLGRRREAFLMEGGSQRSV